MDYIYQLSEEAEEDVIEGYEWYEKRQLGLGDRFISALDLARQKIIANPKTYNIIYKGKVRSFLVSKFPYIVLYIVNGNSIDVIAIFNTNQHPRKWEQRVYH